MASSDSDDFESADEDVVDSSQTELATKSGLQHVPTLQPTIKEVEQENNELALGLGKNDDGAGDVFSSTEHKAAGDVSDNEVGSEKGETIPGPSNRKQRQQKHREPKISNKPKKLGTKITLETKSISLQPVISSPDEIPSSQNKPLTAQHMETPGTDKSELAASTRPTSDVDPYEKFKGYSIPPNIQQCWEDGVDNNLLYGISSVTNPTEIESCDKSLVAPVMDKLSQAAASTEQDMETPISDKPELAASTKPTSDIDPYEKFKGYSMPPNIQQCWEDGVDNNLLYGISSVTKPIEIKTGDESLVAPVMDKLSQAAADKHVDSTWGGWGNWGVTSLLSSATEGVSTLTSHVSSVLESGIGAPNPEEFARINQLEKNKFEAEASELPVPLVDSSGEEPTGIFSFGQLMTSMSSISKLVESTGSKVLSGGLDTLETIGKKTMEVLQEGDPGLKKKRALFSDTTVLSQILREAKEQAELDDKEAENKQATRNIHFETLFDDYQGLVHLEALEMLSKQCDLKLQSLLLSSSGSALSQLQGKLQEVKETCQLPDDEDINEEENDPSDWWKELTVAEEILGVPIATDKLSRVWNDTQEWLKDSKRNVDTMEDTNEEYSAKEVHKRAVSTLAQLTATSVEQFHKGAELLLVKEKRNPAEEAKALKQITSVLCLQVSSTATNFCEHLNTAHTEASPSDSVNSLITNVFLEASNSSSYIQEAFQLLIPVLQVGVTS